MFAVTTLAFGLLSAASPSEEILRQIAEGRASKCSVPSSWCRRATMFLGGGLPTLGKSTGYAATEAFGGARLVLVLVENGPEHLAAVIPAPERGGAEELGRALTSMKLSPLEPCSKSLCFVDQTAVDRPLVLLRKSGDALVAVRIAKEAGATTPVFCEFLISNAVVLPSEGVPAADSRKTPGKTRK